MSVLTMKNVKKSFGDVQVLRDISLTVEQGQVLAIIGPSGSGKSTLLRCATLLTEMTDGSLYYLDQPAAESKGGSVDTAVHLLRSIGDGFGRTGPDLKRKDGIVRNHVHSFSAFGDITVDTDVIFVTEGIPLGIDHGHSAPHHGNGIDAPFRGSAGMGRFSFENKTLPHKSVEAGRRKVPVTGMKHHCKVDVIENTFGDHLGFTAGFAPEMLPAMIVGGHQEENLRSGTEPTAQIAAFAAAVEEWQARTADVTQNKFV